MKKFKNYLVSMMAVAALVACSDDDPGMAPIAEGNDVTVEVKRDTADVYKIEVPISSEEGVASVTLINRSDDSVVDEQTTFSTPNNYTYRYDFDLTPYTDNSAIVLVLQIKDKAGQIAEKKFTLNVKKFSELDVRFGTENTIISQFENVNVKMTVIRGLIPLKEIQVYVENKLMETFDMSLDPALDRYDLNVQVKGLEIGDNNVKVVVIDEKDQKFDKSTVITRIASKKWSDILQAIWMEAAEFAYNWDQYWAPCPQDGKLYNISVTDAMMEHMEALVFKYDAAGHVSKMTHEFYVMDWDIYDFNKNATVDYVYTYNENGELQKVTKSENAGNAKDYITDVVYESGNIKSYKIDGKAYTPKYIEKAGEMIRADYLDKKLSGWEGDFEQAYPNLMYMPELPAVVPGDMLGFAFNNFYDRYFFETLKAGDEVKVTYTITLVPLSKYTAQSIQGNDDSMLQYVY